MTDLLNTFYAKAAVYARSVWAWLAEDGLPPWMTYLLGLTSLLNGLTRWNGFADQMALLWIVAALLWFALAAGLSPVARARHAARKKDAATPH